MIMILPHEKFILIYSQCQYSGAKIELHIIRRNRVCICWTANNRNGVNVGRNIQVSAVKVDLVRWTCWDKDGQYGQDKVQCSQKALDGRPSVHFHLKCDSSMKTPLTFRWYGQEKVMDLDIVMAQVLVAALWSASVYQATMLVNIDPGYRRNDTLVSSATLIRTSSLCSGVQEEDYTREINLLDPQDGLLKIISSINCNLGEILDTRFGENSHYVYLSCIPGGRKSVPFYATERRRYRTTLLAITYSSADGPDQLGLDTGLLVTAYLSPTIPRWNW